MTGRDASPAKRGQQAAGDRLPPRRRPPTDLTLRPATPADAPAIGSLYTETRAAAVPLMPPAIHSAAEDLAHFGGLVADAEHEVWVAEDAGELVGFAVLTATWLDHLYVHPAHQQRGVGTALLELVTALRPEGLGLWVFESNAPARQLYRQHGFVEVERTDGSGNEERAPDIRMEWPGHDHSTRAGSAAGDR